MNWKKFLLSVLFVGFVALLGISKLCAGFLFREQSSYCGIKDEYSLLGDNNA